MGYKSTNLPDELVQQIDEFIKGKPYTTRTDFIKFCVRLYIHEYREEGNGRKGKTCEERCKTSLQKNKELRDKTFEN